MTKIAILALATLAVAACSSNSLTKAQDVLNHESDGGPGSWQCIEHFGDQSRCPNPQYTMPPVTPAATPIAAFARDVRVSIWTLRNAVNAYFEDRGPRICASIQERNWPPTGVVNSDGLTTGEAQLMVDLAHRDLCPSYPPY